MKIVNVELHNFGSFKDQIIKFENGVYLIQGENKTDEGQESNGSGKSFIVEAVAYCLLGSSLRKVKDKDLIRRGEKKASVAITLSDGKQKIEIARIIHRSKSSEYLISINGEVVTDHYATVSDFNKGILELISLTRDEVLSYYLLSKVRYTSFITSSDTAKKQVINRFSRADLIDNVFPEIDQLIKNNSDDIRGINSQLRNLEGKLEVLSQDTPDYTSDIEKLASQIEEITKENSLLQQSIKKQEPEIKKIDELIKKAKKSLLESESALSDKEKELRHSKKNLSNLEHQFDHAQLSLTGGLIECPECKHSFAPELDLSKEDLSEIVKVLGDEIKTASKSTDSIKKEIEILYDAREFDKNYVSHYELTKRSANDDILNMKDQVDRNTRLIGLHKRQIDKYIELDKNDNSIRKSALQEDIEACTDAIKLHEQNVVDYEKWKAYFKSFKSHLANTSLEAIEDRTNHYLMKLNSNLVIRLEGFKELASGKLKENITFRILKNGDDESDFFALSGGEQARVEIATIMAMKEIINESTASGLDMLILDEIIESVDAEGIKQIIHSLEATGMNILLITHSKIGTAHQNVINVIKENNISKIIA